MNINEDSCKVVSKDSNSPTTKYGVMGLTLGKELKTKLDKYCADRSIIKSRLIKALIEEYLNQKDI